jgi:D-alanine--D-alanine ligase
MEKLKVAVVMGGDSAEREVSLQSGEAVFANLDRVRYEPVRVVLENRPDCPEALPEILREKKVDLAFLALHGGAGEDGHIQAVLETVGLPYTGSGPEASAKAMNKIISKRIFEQAGIPTPRSRGFEALTPEQLPATAEAILAEFSLPVVIKPASQGSTIGISIVREKSQLQSALAEALKYDSDILAEEFIAGREITVGILGNAEPEVLPLVEIVATGGFYDYHAKYIAPETEKLCPAPLPETVAAKARVAALAAYQALGCRGISRVDVLVRDEAVFVLEANTLPGMTGDHSLVPCAARAAGLSYAALLDRIIRFALEPSRHVS